MRVAKGCKQLSVRGWVEFANQADQIEFFGELLNLRCGEYATDSGNPFESTGITKW